MRAAATACVVLALAVCAWFGFGIHQAHDLAAAQAIVSAGNTLSATQANRASASLSGARTLNPDREVDIVHAEVDIERRELGAARRILLGVTRAEPRNIEAWLWLAKASSNNAQLYLRAVTQIQRLEPPRRR